MAKKMGGTTTAMPCSWSISAETKLSLTWDDRSYAPSPP
jgi:hypothetical protein